MTENFLLETITDNPYMVCCRYREEMRRYATKSNL